MPETILKDDRVNLTLTFETIFPPDHQECLELRKNLLEVHNVVPMDKITYEYFPETATADYELKALDGRKWKQALAFTALPNSDPFMTFDVADPWKLSEFGSQRALRLRLVHMTDSHGLLKVVCKWS